MLIMDWLVLVFAYIPRRMSMKPKKKSFMYAEGAFCGIEVHIVLSQLVEDLDKVSVVGIIFSCERSSRREQVTSLFAEKSNLFRRELVDSFALLAAELI